MGGGGQGQGAEVAPHPRATQQLYKLLKTTKIDNYLGKENIETCQLRRKFVPKNTIYELK